jgi:hypothetical protein
MNIWKVIGLAGLAGVAAAGVVIVREQRQRSQLTPEEIRTRLHERLEQASAAAAEGTGSAANPRFGVPAAPASSWLRGAWPR